MNPSSKIANDAGRESLSLHLARALSLRTLLLGLTCLVLGLFMATAAGQASDSQGASDRSKAPREYRPTTHVPAGEAVAFPVDI